MRRRSRRIILLISANFSPSQETVSWLCRPQTYANPRLLVVHRTGSGKTATMIRVADNFYLDKRPKILLFPNKTVCDNFYRELREPKFPNRYANYLDAISEPDARKGLELHGLIKMGCVPEAYLDAPALPSAPLRAFTYTQAGGNNRRDSRDNSPRFTR